MIIIKPNPIRTNFLFKKMEEVDDLIERAIKNYNQVNDQYVLLKNELFSTNEELENVFFMKSSLQDFISALRDKKEIIYRNLEKELNLEVDGFKSSLDDLEIEIDNLNFI